MQTKDLLENGCVPFYFVVQRTGAWVFTELMGDRRDANCAARRLNKLTGKLTRTSKALPEIRLTTRKDGVIRAELVRAPKILAFPL